MTWPDQWTSDDGLGFTKVEAGWRVDITRELPARLGEPCGVELPAQGSVVEAGAILLAIELSKARVEFAAPERVEVWEARNLSGISVASEHRPVVWSLVILPRSS